MRTRRAPRRGCSVVLRAKRFRERRDFRKRAGGRRKRHQKQRPRVYFRACANHTCSVIRKSSVAAAGYLRSVIHHDNSELTIRRFRRAFRGVQLVANRDPRIWIALHVAAVDEHNRKRRSVSSVLGEPPAFQTRVRWVGRRVRGRVRGHRGCWPELGGTEIRVRGWHVGGLHSGCTHADTITGARDVPGGVARGERSGRGDRVRGWPRPFARDEHFWRVHELVHGDTLHGRS
mmetsp:Transcript_5000/g.18649  ORF Transcript_5000/g.18649 Transcript_5000/m.18649 type:complete len:232 (+) Transcript_5000:3313-4008(+)